MINRIIVAHPQQQHSYKIASAMKKNGMLESYITTVYYNEKKMIYKILKLVMNNNQNFIRMINRRNEDLNINRDIKTEFELLGLLLTFLIRIDKKRKVYFKVQNYVDKVFGIKVAKRSIENKVSTLIMFDKKASHCFTFLKNKKSDILKVLDMSSPIDNYTSSLMMAQMNKYPEFKENFNIYKNLDNSTALMKTNKELNNSDFFVAASTFTKKSLIFNNIDSEKIYVIPYGIDIEKYKAKEDYCVKDEINFLYTGGIHPRKGIISLLEAFKKVDNVSQSKLNLAGQIIGDNKILNKYNMYYKYLGHLRKDQMNDLYLKNDVFIQPSLHDGFSFSILEAMATGLPIICSENTAGTDLVSDGYNGFVVKPGDEEELAEKIKFFIDNPQQIEIMGKRARMAAKDFSWKKYEELYSKMIMEINEKKQK